RPWGREAPRFALPRSRGKPVCCMTDDVSNDPSGARPDDHAPPAARSRSLSELLVALLDSSPSLIFLKDTSYRYLFVNRRFAEANARTADELIGQTDAFIMPPRAAAQVRADEAKVLETRTAYVYEEEVELHTALGHYSTI